MAGTKAKQQVQHKNVLEALLNTPRDIGKGVVDQVKTNAQESSFDFLSQMLGIDAHEKHEHRGKEMKPGEEISLTKKKEANPDIAPALDWRSEILHGGTRIRRTETNGLQQKFAEIRAEMARFAASYKAIQTKVAEHTLAQAPKEIGTYHVNLLEFILITIRQARQKTEDAGAWLNVAKKKGRPAKEWKKGNTAYTMSSERSTATQTG